MINIYVGWSILGGRRFYSSYPSAINLNPSANCDLENYTTRVGSVFFILLLRLLHVSL